LSIFTFVETADKGWEVARNYTRALRCCRITPWKCSSAARA